MTTEIKRECKACKTEGMGNYCRNCGQAFITKRLTIKSMLHEAFHFFTHLDKGFPFTLKKLIIAPGKMQREYIEGGRANYQKPFSMFFLCATFAALALYWINTSLVRYFDAGDIKEAAFFHQYWVLLQVCMFPVYALITYLFFKGSGLNFAEIAVFQLYLFSFLFVLLTMIHLLKFIFPHLQTRYIELPAIILYSIVTNLKFFNKRPKGMVIVKTVFIIAISFFLAGYIQDLLVRSGL